MKQAEGDIENREARLNEIFDRFERGFTLLGATAVEDRLQDEVPQTIADLQSAGIKIWMLTGDKLETAENIGFSCRLLTADMTIWRCSNEADVRRYINKDSVENNKHLVAEQQKRAFLVEAGALNVIMADDATRANFVRIAKTCEAVICCRVSPSQKADVVRLIKGDDA